MFLLVRDVSAYTEWNPLLLGIFADDARANEARPAYIESVFRDDPWHEQAYKTSDLEADVCVSPIETHCASETCQTA